MNWQDKLRAALQSGDDLKKFRRRSRMWFRRVPGSNPARYCYSYNEMISILGDMSGHIPKEVIDGLKNPFVQKQFKNLSERLGLKLGSEIEIDLNEPPQSGTFPKRDE